MLTLDISKQFSHAKREHYLFSAYIKCHPKSKLSRTQCNIMPKIYRKYYILCVCGGTLEKQTNKQTLTALLHKLK